MTCGRYRLTVASGKRFGTQRCVVYTSSKSRVQKPASVNVKDETPLRAVLSAHGLPNRANSIDVYATSLTDELYVCSNECVSNGLVVENYVSQER